MCNILVLKPGQMLPEEDFWNMCYNNWHSYGLITRVGDKLDIKKKVPESGEIDPQEVWDLVKADIEYERILHVRHNTAGATTLDNAHPIPVYYNPSTGKQVEFMHNGTLYMYKSKKTDEKGVTVDDDSGPSDTMNFVNQILTPLVTGTNFGTGVGDIQQLMFKRIVREFWPGTGNRGILIANDQAPFLFGDWKKEKAIDGSEITTSNTDYFTSVKRGPEYERREAARKKAADARRSESQGSASSSLIHVQPVDSFAFGPMKKHYELSTTLKNIFDDWNVWTREGAAALGAATRDELEELYQDKGTCIALMDWIFTDYYTLLEEHQDECEDHKRATKMIAMLKKELATLKGEEEWKDAA